MKLGHYLTSYTKINSKYIEDLNIKFQIIKNRGSKLFNIGLDNNFLDFTPRAKTRAKINKWDYIKLKSFCIAKKSINKMERQLTEREKIFANHTHGKGLISKIHIRNPYKLSSEKQTIQYKGTNLIHEGSTLTTQSPFKGLTF